MEIINPPGWALPRGYNNGIVVEGGKMLFIAGQIGWDGQQRMVSDNFAGQFAQALENIASIVRHAGGDVTNIVRLLICVTDKKEYLAQIQDVGTAYRQIMGKHFPTMTMVEVKSLLEDNAKVEIEAIAVI
jgi:enamine deaminase RidA (YjgF/YER057c/UK114 family)